MAFERNRMSFDERMQQEQNNSGYGAQNGSAQNRSYQQNQPNYNSGQQAAPYMQNQSYGQGTLYRQMDRNSQQNGNYRQQNQQGAYMDRGSRRQNQSAPFQQGTPYGQSISGTQPGGSGGYQPGRQTQQAAPSPAFGRKQKSQVIFGDELHFDTPQLSGTPKIWLRGKDGNGSHVELPISESLLSRHLMLLGGIGTGKTNAFFQMINQLQYQLTENDVMIIFDTKGDFYKEFYVPGDVVISNDKTAIGPNGHLNYWNIFNEVDKGPSEYESVMEISKQIFAEAIKKTTQIFFPNAAKDIFMGCMLHFLRSVPPREQTNKNLIGFINSKTSKEIREMLLQYPDLVAMTSYISKDDSAQTQGVLSELQSSVRNVFVGNFAKTGNLALRSLVREKQGRKIFIEYDLSLGEMLTPIYSLMFDMAIKQALGRSRSEGNVYFITDEFRLLPNLQHIDDAVNFGRSLGIKFMIGIQNIEQIFENYGEYRARSILSGFLTSFNFRVNDNNSRQYIQEMFGKNRKLEAYMPILQNRGMVEEERDGNVVEDWNVTNLQIGQAIIGIPGYEPFLFQFDLYPEKS